MNTAKLRPVLPLLLINGGAAYAQGAYAYEQIAPDAWNAPSKVAFALAFSAAMESVAVYVQWHAHDALLLRAHATAASLRRASWGIAGVVGAINYAHFAGKGMAPTAASVAFALLSLLSPWLWGLHTRRAQHVQLLAEDSNLIDNCGVEFSPQRRRAFPYRSWAAKRWSIDHGERDPRKAWEGYNAERLARKAGKRQPAHHVATPPADTLTAIVDATTPATVATPQPATDAPQRPANDAPRRPAKRTPARAAKQRQSNAERVATAVAKKPELTQADVAKLLQLGERTVQRYWPKPPATVNGHHHAQEVTQ